MRRRWDDDGTTMRRDRAVADRTPRGNRRRWPVSRGATYHRGVHIAWRATGHDGDPRNRRADLFGPYTAEIGPNVDGVHNGWWWAVYKAGSGKDPIVVGFGYDERDARQAVAEWARPRAPRTLGRRLRAFGRSFR